MILDNQVRAEDDDEAAVQTLFALLLGLRQPAIAGVYVQGKRAIAPSPE